MFELHKVFGFKNNFTYQPICNTEKSFISNFCLTSCKNRGLIVRLPFLTSLENHSSKRKNNIGLINLHRKQGFAQLDFPLTVRYFDTIDL